MKKTIAVIGATGQIGMPLSKGLLANGHQVVAISRSKNSNNEGHINELEALGAKIVFCSNYCDVEQMTKTFLGCDVVVAATSAKISFITEVQPKLLEAAVKAGVKRFVPTEFGCHTMSIEYGEGELFDHKKSFHKLLKSSDIDWTLIYNGGIFDYFLPNLRFFEKITTFGDLELPIYTHDINDIGRAVALAVVDVRTKNRCFQMDYNKLTQNQMLKLLKSSWPEKKFEFEHFSTEYILDQKEKAGNTITAKKGEETDKERWGINFICYVAGKLAAFDENTVRASDLFPDFKCMEPSEAIKNPAFVFENSK